MWRSTVDVPIPSATPISLFDRPAASSANTSRSRRVRGEAEAVRPSAGVIRRDATAHGLIRGPSPPGRPAGQGKGRLGLLEPGPVADRPGQLEALAEEARPSSCRARSAHDRGSERQCDVALVAHVPEQLERTANARRPVVLAAPAQPPRRGCSSRTPSPARRQSLNRSRSRREPFGVAMSPRTAALPEVHQAHGDPRSSPLPASSRRFPRAARGRIVRAALGREHAEVVQ